MSGLNKLLNQQIKIKNNKSDGNIVNIHSEKDKLLRLNVGVKK